jgi:PhnB protein
MAGKVEPIPEGYASITPYLVVNDAAGAIEFYKRAFGATEVVRMPGPGGKVAHAEIRIGNSMVMLADEHPEVEARSPRHYRGTPVSLVLYVEDVDRVVKGAIDLGAKLQRPVQDQFYGDRSGTLFDPFGHQWTIATHKEDVTPEEMKKRMAAMQH